MRLFVISLLGILLFTSAHGLAKEKPWQEIKGENFIIRYRKDVPKDFAQTILDSAQDEFVRISANMGITRYQNWKFDNRAVIFVYNDEQDYVHNGGQYGWSHGTAFIQSKSIKTYPQAHGFFDSTLPHELAHIIFRELVGINADVPLWFEEGIAMNQEKAKRFGANKQVRELIEKGKFIPLTELTNMRLYNNSDVDTVQIFYTESASAFQYLLNEYGEQKLFRLLSDLKENMPFEAALSKQYMRLKSIADLNKWWVNFLKDGS